METILESYLRARQSETFAGHELRQTFEKVKQNLSSIPAIAEKPSLKVKWSIGQGNWSKVPWISLLDDRETNSTQDGVYCVYLFRQDMSGIYLTFNQGVTKLISELGKAQANLALRQRAKELRPLCKALSERGFSLDENIDLRADPGLGADYETSTIAYKLYERGNLPDESGGFKVEVQVGLN